MADLNMAKSAIAFIFLSESTMYFEMKSKRILSVVRFSMRLHTDHRGLWHIGPGVFGLTMSCGGSYFTITLVSVVAVPLESFSLYSPGFTVFKTGGLPFCPVSAFKSQLTD